MSKAVIEYPWADGAYDRLPTLAADLVRRRVAVIAATGGHFSGLAAKAATSSIPIVFNAGEDPVTLGLVTSINRPGGNATGIYIFLAEMDTKRLELLRELVPNAALIAVLLNPTWIRFKAVSKEIAEAARAAGQRIDVVEASNEHEIHGAFKRIAPLRPQALLVGADPFFNARREQLVTLANHYAPNVDPTTIGRLQWLSVQDQGGCSPYALRVSARARRRCRAG
jgi:putative tryptophan/tyrosine transport system substrate-binding protein